MPTKDEDIAFLPAHRLSALLKARKITSTRLTRIYLERLQRLNPTLLCAVTIMEPQALAEAARADAEIAAGRYRGPLHGIPYGVKDLFATKGVPTTWGARDFEGRVIDEDAEVVTRLREAGAVLIAKLATGLFAQNDQWFGGRTNNPWNLSQGSSGSSAGPASATAAACVAFAHRHRDAGVDRVAGAALRRERAAPHVRAREPRRRDGARVVAGPRRADHPHGRGRGDGVQRHPRRRPEGSVHGDDAVPASTRTSSSRRCASASTRTRRRSSSTGCARSACGRSRSARARRCPASAGGGLNVEYAAAFDDYVQRKAKEIGLDLNTVVTPTTNGAAVSGHVADGDAPARRWRRRTGTRASSTGAR